MIVIQSLRLGSLTSLWQTPRNTAMMSLLCITVRWPSLSHRSVKCAALSRLSPLVYAFCYAGIYHAPISSPDMEQLDMVPLMSDTPLW